MKSWKPLSTASQQAVDNFEHWNLKWLMNTITLSVFVEGNWVGFWTMHFWLHMYSVTTKQTWVMKLYIYKYIYIYINRDKETRTESYHFHTFDLWILCSVLNGCHLTIIKLVTCTSADPLFIEDLVGENCWDGSTTTLGMWLRTWLEDHQVSLISLFFCFTDGLQRVVLVSVAIPVIFDVCVVFVLYLHRFSIAW
jgi:hypothetical protein